jgi:hypothetical protein
LSHYENRPETVQTLDGEYKATYGVLLVQAIQQRNSQTSEFERVARKEAMTNANAALRYAIPRLKQRVDAQEKEQLSRDRLEDRLFALLEEQDYLRRAAAALKSLEEMER